MEAKYFAFCWRWLDTPIVILSRSLSQDSYRDDIQADDFEFNSFTQVLGCSEPTWKQLHQPDIFVSLTFWKRANLIGSMGLVSFTYTQSHGWYGNRSLVYSWLPWFTWAHCHITASNQTSIIALSILWGHEIHFLFKSCNNFRWRSWISCIVGKSTLDNFPEQIHKES